MTHEHWLSSVVKQIIAKQVGAVTKEAADVDMTLSVLQELLGQGYQFVTWVSGGSHCAKCLALDNQKWNLEEFVSGLNHNAPMAERSHPNDKNCRLIVEGEGLTPVTVDYYGGTQSA